MPVDPKSICQIALVVDDVEKVAKNYAELFGIEMPKCFLGSDPKESRTTYRGQPTGARAKLCVFNLGPLVLELSQTTNDEPSSWKQFREEHGEGVHHIGFAVKDRREVMDFFASKGADERHYGEYPGGSYTFVDSEKEFGVIINVKADE